jgi:hypothetical protein
MNLHSPLLFKRFADYDRSSSFVVVFAFKERRNKTLRVWARMELGLGYAPIVASSLVVTNTNNEGAVSFPVPSELFRFELYFAFGTEAHARLAFYLTYA